MDIAADKQWLGLYSPGNVGNVVIVTQVKSASTFRVGIQSPWSFPENVDLYTVELQSQSLVPLRASPRVSTKVPGRPVERHYSLMSCSTNSSLNWPVREGPA
jgi:hypothetical protein